jgi:lipid II:glycine glycyltransferase (peptidoglycan interpeptide bridge formation enzyme)
MGDVTRTSGSGRYELRVATDPRRWNSLVDASPTPYFSQLWEWGEVQRAIGWEPWRLELVPAETDGGACIAAAQILIRRLPGIGWGIGHAPRGPVLGRAAEDWARFEVALVRWARDNRVATLVFDPDVSSESDLAKALMRPPWRAAPIFGEPKCHVVDVLPEAELWANVRRKHRQWIRHAEGADIDIRWIDDSSGVDDARLAIRQFQQVYGEIAQRMGLPLQAPDYYQLMWDLFRKAGRAHMVTATADGSAVGAILHFSCGDELLSFAGGQTAGGAHLGVGKLLVWRSMLRAGELGARRYNMWGTRTEGLAHFKVGFGARAETYIGTRSMSVNRRMDLLLGAAWRARQFSRRINRR